jgi:hypothetical protein
MSNENESSRAFTNGSGYIRALRVLNAPNETIQEILEHYQSSANMDTTIIRRGNAIQGYMYNSNYSIRVIMISNKE